MASGELVFQVSLLNSAYARCIDGDRLEEWPEFFLESALYKVTTEENYSRGWEIGIIFADSRAMLVDRITSLRHANIFERHRYRHLVGMPAILGVQGHEVQAETPFAVFRIMRDGSNGLFVTGRYVDRIRRMDGDAMKFAERVVVCDTSTIDTLMVIPL